MRGYVGACAAPPLVEHVYADVYFGFCFLGSRRRQVGRIAEVACSVVFACPALRVAWRVPICRLWCLSSSAFAACCSAGSHLSVLVLVFFDFRCMVHGGFPSVGWGVRPVRFSCVLCCPAGCWVQFSHLPGTGTEWLSYPLAPRWDCFVDCILVWILLRGVGPCAGESTVQ